MQKGILFGIFAGILDVFFLLFQKLTIELSVSLFLTCVVCGVFIASTNSNIKGIWRGGGIAILLLAPQFVFMAQQTGISMVPPLVATILLCALTGHIVTSAPKEKIVKFDSQKPKSGLFKETKIGINRK